MTDEDAIIEMAWTEFRDTKGVKAGGLVYVTFKKSVTAALAAMKRERDEWQEAALDYYRVVTENQMLKDRVQELERNLAAAEKLAQ